MSESQSRRLARAFQVLESASKAFVGPKSPNVGAEEPTDAATPRAPGAPLPWNHTSSGNTESSPSAEDDWRAPQEGRPGPGRREGRGRGGGRAQDRGEGRREQDGEARADEGSNSKDSDRARGGTKRGRGAELSPEEAAERVSPAALDRAALDYLNRYDASVEQLRRVLLRRVKRYSSGSVRDRAEADVRTLLERFQVSRLLDDARYAEALARGLRARGSSTLGIRQKLRSRGVSAELIEGALEALARHHGDADEDPELVAARAYARKRRLTTRYDLTKPEERQKALAALARKGFSFSIAARALIVKDDSEW